MKNVYVKPEVEYINFYSEEKITSGDNWDSNYNEGIDGVIVTPTISIGDKEGGWL